MGYFNSSREESPPAQATRRSSNTLKQAKEDYDILKKDYDILKKSYDTLEKDYYIILQERNTIRERKLSDEREIHESKARIVSLEQGQDYRSRKGTTDLSYKTIVENCAKLEHDVLSWAENIFTESQIRCDRLPASILHLPQVSSICSSGITLAKLAAMEVYLSDLISAVTLNHIFSDIIVQSLDMCTPRFKEQLQSPLWEQLSGNDQPLAKAAQAGLLKIYFSEETLQWDPYFTSLQNKKEAEEILIQQVCQKILDSLQQISPFDHTSQQPTLGCFLINAVNISKMLAELASGIELLDKDWLLSQSQSRPLRANDHRLGIHGTCRTQHPGLLGSTLERDCDFVVLSPGLLKWGRENGEGWNCWDVYAKLAINVYAPPTYNMSGLMPINRRTGTFLTGANFRYKSAPTEQVQHSQDQTWAMEGHRAGRG